MIVLAEIPECLETHNDSILPKLILLLMRLLGLFIYRNDPPKRSKSGTNCQENAHEEVPPGVSYIWLLWTLLLIAFAVLVCLADVVYFVRLSSTLIIGLEFFTLVLWVFRFSAIVSFPAILTIMLVVSRNLLSLLGVSLIYLFYLTFIGACVSLQETIFFLLLYACKIRLKKLSVEVGSILADCQRRTSSSTEEKIMHSQRIRSLSRKHTTLQGVVEDVTKAFGSTSLAVWSLKDIAGCLALLALLFQRPPKPTGTPGTEPSEMIGLEFMYVGSQPIIIVVGVCSVAHAVTRIISCLGITNENNKLKKLMTKATTMRQVSLDTNFSFECFDFLERLEIDELIISPHGFHSISWEYGASLIGLVVSYFLIMYQLQDQKLDMESLMAYREAQYLFRTLKENASVHFITE
ncbi:hypothetical protein BV898_04151 [Hypsibius exemplaris]|uniref:Gustatory receptor n=1 Tax=Hypsibius exemplaris TaxID=2072580 RepID=A0A1W0X3D7_HYPEX|nr:hypothetical protein BV898_04151 [Hypsibius exemplaris]